MQNSQSSQVRTSQVLDVQYFQVTSGPDRGFLTAFKGLRAVEHEVFISRSGITCAEVRTNLVLYFIFIVLT